MLQAIGIRKQFSQVKALDDIELQVRPGRITMLVGPSGAGKTTLLKVMGFLEAPDEGKIAFGGSTFTYPLREGHPVPSPWPDVTLVFQQHFLWPHLTIRENILLPARHRKLSGIDERYRDLVEALELGTFADRYPNETSLGQRQRAAIARALILEPKFLLLDEITSALDVEQIEQLFKHLLFLRSRGIGILVVTHLLGLARELLRIHPDDEIAFMEEGRILGRGGLEFLSNPADPRIAEFFQQMRFAT